MLAEAFTVPFRGAHAKHSWAVLTGSVLATAILFQGTVALAPNPVSLLAAVLLVGPVLVWAGYCRRVVGQHPDGTDGLPEPGSVRELAGAGVATGVLTAAYLVVPTVILLVTVAGVQSVAPASVRGGGGLVFLTGSTVSVVVALAVSYLYPGALGRLASGSSFSNALDPRQRGTVYRDPTYLVTWASATTVGVLGAAVFGVALTNRGPLGLLAALVSVYASLVASRLVGLGWHRVSDSSSRRP
ncbi:DUF4013 domain-containing protein [Haloarchaeobius sp. TZWWS8]|uniref:DUF4013 domain-containing protein n=1 Tax=Haloarchaeobius sp. TZWWS8 TaxID=3446121 RepID=UPI003EC0BEA0